MSSEISAGHGLSHSSCLCCLQVKLLQN